MAATNVLPAPLLEGGKFLLGFRLQGKHGATINNIFVADQKWGSVLLGPFLPNIFLTIHRSMFLTLRYTTRNMPIAKPRAIGTITMA